MIMVKCIVLFVAASMLLGTLLGAEEKRPNESALLTYLAGQKFDPEAAKSFDADTYGMRKYVMAFLRSGPKRPATKEEAQKLQLAHLENIEKMAAAGKLVLAGPFLDGGELRGIYIFAVATIAEAEALTNSDPAIQAGSLAMELREWYGSAALMALNPIHNRLAEKTITGK